MAIKYADAFTFVTATVKTNVEVKQDTAMSGIVTVDFEARAVSV
jgi:hypothetical protein